MNSLKTILAGTILSAAVVSCTSNETIYNGFVKNNTQSSISIKIEAEGDALLADSFAIPSGETVKVAFETEGGDIEIYDCATFFDTINYSIGNKTYELPSDSAVITPFSKLGADGTRLHECTVIIE